ncbi:hypothetical protein H0H81_010589 [Sphagnurus paluster]|uniref:F-box domain-containing protein n=1 Tax=Sphagnurus paluster TaxID=117069 RepID=A0A9P7FSU7_9AGAR|nr:hypothetical protein H0H81_010589 [Sphagnurus paluster]
MRTSREKTESEYHCDDVKSRASSLAHILKTNDPPSELELQEIRLLLRDTGGLASNSKPSNDLKMEHPSYSPLCDLHSSLRSAASILRRIPAEILIHIFSQCLVHDFCDGESVLWNDLDMTKPPWTLVRVSKRWRDIALAHQPLWSCIRLNFWALENGGRHQPTLPELQLCLQRSGNHPLSISISDHYTSSATSKQLFHHLVSFSEQWKYLQISGPFTLLALATPIKGKISRLETLGIELDGSDPCAPIDIFGVAPALRNVRIHPLEPLRKKAFGHPYIFNLPWSQLTRLEVECLGILDDTPQLESCILGFDVSTFQSSEILRHTKLRSLVTRSAAALDRLEIPSLETLHFCNIIDEPDALRKITSFISRSGCSLRNIIISKTSILVESDLDPLLQMIPTITSLTIEYGYVMWDVVARVLTVTDTLPIFAPKLEKITFFFGKKPPPPKLDFELLSKMLESRMTSQGDTSRLESVNLYDFAESPPTEFLYRVSGLRDLGLRAVIDAC